MLTGLHILLTYQCTYECDHCFLYCSPRAKGTLTLDEIDAALRQGIEAGIDHIYIEGGEPFLFYPLLLETVRAARALDLDAGIVSNCYWATSRRDAVVWLRPLVELGLDSLSVSDDTFHSEDPENSPARVAAAAAAELGLPAASICIEAPTVQPTSEKGADGAVIGGDVLFKGRAADMLTEGLPRRDPAQFDSCPHEELESPTRVHLDPFGSVFVCQGISIGNIWQKSLRQIMADYQPREHPVVGPLVTGGPAALAQRVGLPHGTYVDHCHLCYVARKKVLSQYPDLLTPPWVYGEQD
jgi:hypothetical protein